MRRIREIAVPWICFCRQGRNERIIQKRGKISENANSNRAENVENFRLEYRKCWKFRTGNIKLLTNFYVARGVTKELLTGARSTKMSTQLQKISKISAWNCRKFRKFSIQSTSWCLRFGVLSRYLTPEHRTWVPYCTQRIKLLFYVPPVSTGPLCTHQYLFASTNLITSHDGSTGWPKSASDLKMLSKDSLINLLRKFQLRLHLWSITINTQTNFQIISQYRIFCETCPTLVQKAILWNNAPTWLNNIFEPVCRKLHSSASKRSLRRCQTLKRSNEYSKLLTRSKMTWDREKRILSQTTIKLNQENIWKSILVHLRAVLPNSLVTSAKQCGRHWKKKAFFPTEYQCCTN